jgi:aspartate aminotransferase
MPVTISDYLSADPEAAKRRALTPNSASLQGSMILRIAKEAGELARAGRPVVNFTIGDFKPGQFSIPADLSAKITEMLRAGNTNYQPAAGVLELQQALSRLYTERLGIEYSPDAFVIGSGARPPIYASWKLFVEPGDKTVSFLPMWNIGYYAHLFKSDHHFVPTTAENDFFPTVAQATEAMRGARLMLINSPLNPTGTAISVDVMRGIAQALVAENATRDKPCMLVFDQVYWMLTAPGTTHANPVALVPECAPYVIHVDAISKCFAATGLRLGWGVMPPYIQQNMKALIAHMGAWSGRPAQMATAWYLSQPGRMDAYMDDMREAIGVRLDRLYAGITAMRDEGLPVDAIAPQGAIYLSFHVDIVGRPGFPDNESVRRFLLEEADTAVVPFQAFDLPDDSGWFRMSIGAVGLEDIDASLDRMRAALHRL